MLTKKLKLNAGEKLVETGSRAKGPMGEREITSYDVVDASDAVIGTAVHTDEITIKGLKRRQSVVYYDLAGKILVEDRWGDD